MQGAGPGAAGSVVGAGADKPVQTLPLEGASGPPGEVPPPVPGHEFVACGVPSAAEGACMPACVLVRWQGPSIRKQRV